MQISQRSLFVGPVLALALAGCTLVPTSKVGEGQACTDDGRCASGYVCNRVTNACVKDDGSGCPDADNDGVTTCEADCDDTNPTCTTDCTDADSDGTCVTDDCNDNEPLCAADCVTNSDNDEYVDCLDTCVDADGDEVGTSAHHSGCVHTLVSDSDDDDPEKCADTDEDGCDDCVSGTYDPNNDGDDADEDGVCDAGDTCVDVDKDGVGRGANDTSGCAITDEADCDDNAATCIKDCVTDVDEDGIPDCRDGCLDFDGDGAGRAGGAGNSCTGPDCKDNDNVCTTDCTACPPAALVLTTEDVAVCETSNMSIDLDWYTGAADQLSCESLTVNLNGPIGFEHPEVPWDIWTDKTDQVTLREWAGSTSWTCDSSNGSFARFNNTGFAEHLQLGTPFNATGWQNVKISFDVQYNGNTGVDDKLSVLSCCGSGCEPAEVGAVPNATNDCQLDATFPLSAVPADNCSQLMIEFEFNGRSIDGRQVGIDNVALSGELMFTEIVETSTPGEYETAATSCQRRTIDVTCTWDDGSNEPEFDSEPVDFD